MSPLPVSLILPTLDRPSLLQRCLTSVFAHGEGLELQVVVVDQSKEDTSQKMVEEEFPQVLLLRRTERGAALARNTGASQARHPWLVFGDDDGWFPEGWGRAVAAVLGNDDAPDAVGGRIVSDESGTPFLKGAGLFASPLNPRTVWWVAGPSMHIRREWFDRVGGFDERLGPGRPYGAGEETDLLLRLLQAGARGLYSPRIVVHHPPSPEAGSLGATRARSYGRGFGALFQKQLRGPWRWRMAPWAAAFLVAPAVWMVLEGGDGEKRRTQWASLQGRWEGLLRFPR